MKSTVAIPIFVPQRIAPKIVGSPERACGKWFIKTARKMNVKRYKRDIKVLKLMYFFIIFLPSK